MKETFEWLRCWSDYAGKSDLPRVLLIGDSINEGYQGFVREMLRGVCYVDYLSCSYAIDSEFYRSVIDEYVKDNTYTLIHWNNGLHGDHVTKASYRDHLCLLLDMMKSNLILATSTIVFEKNNVKINEHWEKLVSERNEAIRKIAKERNIPVDDLFACSCALDISDRSEDGIHYTESGYRALAEQVAGIIEKYITNQVR